MCVGVWVCIRMHVVTWCYESSMCAGAISYSGASFGPGSGNIYLDDVGCNGTETLLLSCPNSGINIHNCNHFEDAGVRCIPGKPKSILQSLRVQCFCAAP